MPAAGKDKLGEAFVHVGRDGTSGVAAESFRLRTEVVEEVDAERGVVEKDVAHGCLVYFENFGTGLDAESAAVARVAAKEGFGLNDDRPVIPFGEAIGVVVAPGRHLESAFQDETERLAHLVLLKERLTAFDAAESQTDATCDVEEVFAAEALEEGQEQEIVEEDA